MYSAANEYRHCWEGTCDGLASRPGESVQLHSKAVFTPVPVRVPVPFRSRSGPVPLVRVAFTPAIDRNVPVAGL